jgi:DNA-binding winged helix-turn-helix (wHTH) protein/Tol biopolymer transport system component
MGTPANASAVWRFGVFEADARTGELRRSGHSIKLREQPLRVLLILVEHAGELVTREQLRQRLWPSDTFVDFDHSLNSAVMKLREALGDSADRPLYIETIPKKGYRFLAPVSQSGEERNEIAPQRLIDVGDGAVLPAINGDAPTLPPPPVPIASTLETAAATTSTRFSRKSLLVAAITLVTLATGILWLLGGGATESHPASEQRITSNSPEAAIKWPVISPDGTYLAYSDRTGLYLRQIATGETRRWALPKDFNAIPNSWFPDGTHLLVTRFEGPAMTPSLWKLSVLGGSARELLDHAGAGSVSPDGSRIAFLPAIELRWGQQLWVMGSDGSNPHKIAAVAQMEQPSYRKSQILPVVWSPDGQRLAYIERHAAFTPSPGEDALVFLRTCDANGGDPHLILNDSRMAPALSWAADGRVLFAYQKDAASDHSDQGVRSIRVDQHTGKATGRPQMVTDGPGRIGGISVTSDGKRIVVWRMDSQVQGFIADFDADTRKWKAPRRLTLDANSNAAEAWLADSRTVLVISDRKGTWTLFKQAIDDTTAEVLVEGPSILLPRLSADGMQVLYEYRGGPVSSFVPVVLMRLPVAGGPPQVVLKDPGLLNYQCARLPATLCILSKMQSTEHVFVAFDPERGSGRELLRLSDGVHHWSLSPDGRTLAVFYPSRVRFFSVDDGGVHERNTVTVDDWPIVNGDWSADGKGVLLPSVSPTGTPVILEVDMAGKVSVVLEGAVHTSFWWMLPSADGQHAIVGVEVPGDNNAWMIDKF